MNININIGLTTVVVWDLYFVYSFYFNVITVFFFYITRYDFITVAIFCVDWFHYR